MVRFAAVSDAVSLPVISLAVPFGLRSETAFTELRNENCATDSSPFSDSPDSLDSLASNPNPLPCAPLNVPGPDSSFTDPDTLAADRLEELSEEITSLASQIHAATYRLLTLLAEFDEKRGWEREGHRSCAHWLSFRTGIDLGASRERVRAARALVGLPEIGAAMERGELSFSKVRAITRVATPEDEGELLAFALENTASNVERAVRGWKKRNRVEEKEWERALHESRTLSIFPDDEGMYVIRGKLDPEVGALLMRAIEAASDALYRNNTRGEAVRRAMIGREANEREAAQRRADAIGLLAERAMGAGFGGRDAERMEEGDAVEAAIDGLVSGEGAATRDGAAAANDDGHDDSTPISGTRAERYQVVLHVEAATLTENGEHGRSELEDGVHVSAETSRRISCDCGVICVTHRKEGGQILSVGRRTRTISPALRRALEIRDRGCRFPGCGLRFTDAHHVKHWADGGETSLENCLLLCRHHHRLIHEGGWSVGWWGAGRPAFYDPRGGTHFDGRHQAGKRLHRTLRGVSESAHVELVTSTSSPPTL